MPNSDFNVSSSSHSVASSRSQGQKDLQTAVKHRSTSLGRDVKDVKFLTKELKKQAIEIGSIANKQIDSSIQDWKLVKKTAQENDDRGFIKKIFSQNEEIKEAEYQIKLLKSTQKDIKTLSDKLEKADSTKKNGTNEIKIIANKILSNTRELILSDHELIYAKRNLDGDNFLDQESYEEIDKEDIERIQNTSKKLEGKKTEVEGAVSKLNQSISLRLIDLDYKSGEIYLLINKDTDKKLKPLAEQAIAITKKITSLKDKSEKVTLQECDELEMKLDQILNTFNFEKEKSELLRDIETSPLKKDVKKNLKTKVNKTKSNSKAKDGSPMLEFIRREFASNMSIRS